MSRTRERSIIAAVACPYCGAGIGAPCEFNRLAALPAHLTVHTERRRMWQARRK